MKTTSNAKINNGITEGPMLLRMIRFTIPVILSGVLQLLFNACDIIVVGNFAGNESLAAVGSTSSLITLFTNIFIGLSVASNVLVAHFAGSKDYQGISKTLHTSVFISIFCGIFLAIFGNITALPILRLMGSPEDVIYLAGIYLKIYFLGMPAMLLYNFLAAMLRAVGDTKHPLYFLTGAGFINVGLNLLLVICFKLGVAGVAIATITAHYISAFGLLFFIYDTKADDANAANHDSGKVKGFRQKLYNRANFDALKNGNSLLKFKFSKVSVDREILFKIISIGVPAGVQGMLFSISNVVIQSSVNSFGSVVIAGNSAQMNIEGFVYMAMNGVYQTVITFTGQNYGAGKYKRVLKSLLMCEMIVIVVGLVTGNLTFLFNRNLLRIYSSSDDVINSGLRRAVYILPTYFLCGCMDVLVGALRGIGKSLGPMLTSIFGVCVYRLIWIMTVFRVYKNPGVLYISYPISWLVTGTVHAIMFIYFYKKMKCNSMV